MLPGVKGMGMSADLFRERRVLWMPLEVPWQPPTAALRVCCETMGAALRFSCDQHADPFECADALIVYNEIFDEYGIPVHDGGATYVLIAHCPWCAVKLPESQRDRWFDEVDAVAGDDDPTPERFLSAAWRTGDQTGGAQSE